jgi:hypothetical protein
MSHYTGSVPTTKRAPDWRTKALCARDDMASYRDLFFPHPGEKDKAAAAKRICAACTVRAACLDDALAVEANRSIEHRHGVRGGLGPKARRSEYERRRKAEPQKAPAPEPKPAPKKREPAKCGTRAGYRKHQREKSAICGPCRQANTDADNRLRRTGTSKVAV